MSMSSKFIQWSREQILFLGSVDSFLEPSPPPCFSPWVL